MADSGSVCTFTQTHRPKWRMGWKFVRLCWWRVFSFSNFRCFSSFFLDNAFRLRLICTNYSVCDADGTKMCVLC